MLENISTERRPPDIGLRLAMMLLDHVIFSFTISMVIAPFWLYYFLTKIKPPLQQGFAMPVFEDLWQIGVAYALGMALYLNKDALAGRSPGKRIIKARVVNLRTGATAGPLRCLARNLTLWLWPVEGLLVLINQDRRRLGDYLAGTQVVALDAEPPREPIRWAPVALAYALGAGGLMAVLLPLFLLFQKVVEQMPAFIPPGNVLQEERGWELDPVVRAALGESAELQQVRVFERSGPAPHWQVEISAVVRDQRLFTDETARNELRGRVRAALEEHLPDLPVQGRLQLEGGSRHLTIRF